MISVNRPRHSGLKTCRGRSDHSAPGEKGSETGVHVATFIGYLARRNRGKNHEGDAMSVEKMWEAWRLCDASREYVKKAGCEVPLQEMIDKVFMPSSLVDVERTKSEGGNPPTKVFLRSPYGVEYRADTKNWIPFRHGEVKL
jgi:hypothetical protein